MEAWVFSGWGLAQGRLFWFLFMTLVIRKGISIYFGVDSVKTRIWNLPQRLSMYSKPVGLGIQYWANEIQILTPGELFCLIERTMKEWDVLERVEDAWLCCLDALTWRCFCSALGRPDRWLSSSWHCSSCEKLPRPMKTGVIQLLVWLLSEQETLLKNNF
jgi:hypothetical protein